jgi:hypothetical protein
VAAASLTLVGVVGAAPAGAAPSPKSVQNWCPNDETSAHPGQHLGWSKQSSTERRNVGGTCPTQLPG